MHERYAGHRRHRGPQASGPAGPSGLFRGGLRRPGCHQLHRSAHHHGGPEYQRKGIGGALIKEGHRIAKKLGYHYSIVLGSEKYYPKFGYIPAINYGIMPPFQVENENFMAIKLNETDKEIKGVVKYAKEFGI